MTSESTDSEADTKSVWDNTGANKKGIMTSKRNGGKNIWQVWGLGTNKMICTSKCPDRQWTVLLVSRRQSAVLLVVETINDSVAAEHFHWHRLDYFRASNNNVQWQAKEAMAFLQHWAEAAWLPVLGDNTHTQCREWFKFMRQLAAASSFAVIRSSGLLQKQQQQTTQQQQ